MFLLEMRKRLWSYINDNQVEERDGDYIFKKVYTFLILPFQSKKVDIINTER